MRRGRSHRGAAAGQRAGHGARADHARLLGHLDRARQRLGGPRGGGRARPRRGAAREPGLPAPARLADARRRKPATTTASPTRGCGRCATSPTCGPMFRTARLGAVRRGQPHVRRGGGAGSQDRRPDRAGAGLPLRAAAAHDPRAAARRHDHHLLAHSLAEPRGVRASAPGATKLLDGLLGSSILGFHTQFHCNNFVDTVDRLLEARVDRETFTVSYRRQAHRRASATRSPSSGRRTGD